ncbi:hypothetical protein KVT40_006587 [Elsinoe batatas]|uniref:RING-type domain-containing protein n=1 Tax=Elsinoe batatas TaxID=2601811 RepID=A0A8K0KXX5_9PEZI|nr:hypothetical protein KVT40_006587 [Elsinoe batatas]
MPTYKFVPRDNIVPPATNATTAATAPTKFNTRAIGLVMVPVALALMLLLFAIAGGSDEVQRNDEVWGLGCCHVYHRACLDPWVDQGKRTCPLCHRNLEEDSAGQGRRRRPAELLHLA